MCEAKCKVKVWSFLFKEAEVEVGERMPLKAFKYKAFSFLLQSLFQFVMLLLYFLLNFTLSKEY